MKTSRRNVFLTIMLAVGLCASSTGQAQDEPNTPPSKQGKTTLRLKKSASKTKKISNGKAASESKKATTPPKTPKTKKVSAKNGPKVRIKLPGSGGKVVSPGANQRLSSSSKASSVLPRMQRTPSGTLKPGSLAELQALQSGGAQQKSGKTKLKTSQSRQTAAGRKTMGKKSPTKGRASQKPSVGNKGANRKFQLKPGQTSTAKMKSPTANPRNAGRFQSPKSLVQQGTSSRPRTSMNKQRLQSSTRRMGGRFESPKSPSSTASRQRPSTKRALAGQSKAPKAKSKFKMGGKTSKALGGMAAIGVTAGALDRMSQAKKLRDSGQITQSQYRQMQSKNGLDTVEKLTKLKKLNPASAVMNDVIGTDPISLGFDAVGDVIHGTDNAKQSLQNMGKAWDKSLTKQAFTDPKAAGKRVGQGLEKTGRNIEQGAKKVGKGVKKGAKKVGDAIGGLFKKKKKK